jgi:hypothetical protein
MKFSWVISRVRWSSFAETNVLKTISVLVLRVVEIIWVRWTTQSFYLYLSKLHSQGCPLATGGFFHQVIALFAWFSLLAG